MWRYRLCDFIAATLLLHRMEISVDIPEHVSSHQRLITEIILINQVL